MTSHEKGLLLYSIGLNDDCSYSVIFSWAGYSLSHAKDHEELAGVYACVP